jgi:hypothetical protein
MVANDIRIGPQVAADGSLVTQRGARTGEACVTFAHSYYQEPARNGMIMEACTAVAGVAPGTALGTTPPMAIWNPPNSGVYLHVLKCSMGYVSGTLGAGSLLYAAVNSQTTVPATGTELVPNNTKLGFPRGQGRAFQGSTLASTPTILRAAFTLGAFVGGANPPVPVADVIDGAFCIPPGGVFVLQGLAGAGTSPLVIFAVAWEEIPL